MRSALIVLMLLFGFHAHAMKLETVKENSVPAEQTAKPGIDEQLKSITSLTAGQVQQQLGRRLSLKEKISWFLFKKQLKTFPREGSSVKSANSNAVLGFVFSLVGLLFFPLSIAGLILSISALRSERENPGTLTQTNKGLAVAGKIISYVELALLTLGLIIIAVYLLALASR